MIALLPLLAAAAVPQADACAARMPDYGSWREAPGQQWDFRWPAGGDRPLVTMIGAEHLRDPSHPQFAKIAATVEQADPTILFFEGPDRGVGADEADTIVRFGESGQVRFLARARALGARSLEPSPPDQVKALLAAFPADQVMLFFILRETARMRDREGLAGAALDAGVSAMLAKVGPMAAAMDLAEPLTDLPALDAAARGYWPTRDWRTLPASWFSPGADDEATGGVFLGAVNRADSAFRDRHMARLILEAVAAGERPLVVVGRNHVPMLAPALECALPLIR